MDKSKQSTIEPTIPIERNVSCIKIRGLRILPPLLNEAKRAEMRKYRVQAIEVEQRLKLRNTKKSTNESKDMRRCAMLVDSDNLSISDNVDSSSDSSSDEEDTSRSAVVFDDHSSTAVLDMLKDFKIAKSRVMASVQMPLLDTSAINNVPLTANIQSDNVNTDSKLPMNDIELGLDNKQNLNLTNRTVATRQDTYTVTNENKVFSENVLKELINTESNILLDTPTTESSSNRFQKLEIHNKSDSSINDSISDNKVTTSIDLSRTESIDNSDPSVNTSDFVGTENKENDSKCMPHTLIRSNSYIVETPSPMLLAQMQENNVQFKSDEVKTKETPVKKRRSWDLKSAKEKWSSTDLNLISTPAKVDKQHNEPLNIGKSVSNSLPNSSVPSPNVQMFNSDTRRLVQSQKTRLSNLGLTMKESPTDTNPTQKSNIRSVLKTPDTQRKFVENFVTPMRNWKPTIATERLTQKRIYSEPKPKRLVNTFTKTDIALSRPRTLVVQRRSSEDESHTSINSPCSKAPTNGEKCVTLPRTLVVQRRSSEDESHTSINSPCSKAPTKGEKCVTPKPPDTIRDRIRDILDRIQSEQSMQMAELLDRQRKEQKNMMRMFAAQQALLLTTLKNNQIDMSPVSPKNVEPKSENTVIITDNSPADYNVSSIELDLLKNSENVMAECKKLLKSTSLSGSSITTVSSPDDTLADLTIRSEQNDCYSPHSGDHMNPFVQSSKVIMSHSASAPQRIAAESNKFNRSYSDDSLEPGILFTKFVANKESRKQESVIYYNNETRNNTCNRQLFPTEKQIWAAKKICALARGYLIRRLMKTERVQNLILTIKDTLLCAMDLHHETAETIRPADVELHRRLIQQVTAACYTFHEMFFGLSKAEQMAVIATDRERLKEKAMRPASARSTTSVTSTTQRVMERKMRRASNNGTSGAASRSSSSRSCHSVPEARTRTKSLGLSDSMNSTKKTSPQNDVMRRAMSYGANKKPWR